MDEADEIAYWVRTRKYQRHFYDTGERNTCFRNNAPESHVFISKITYFRLLNAKEITIKTRMKSTNVKHVTILYSGLKDNEDQKDHHTLITSLNKKIGHFLPNLPYCSGQMRLQEQLPYSTKLMQEGIIWKMLKIWAFKHKHFSLVVMQYLSIRANISIARGNWNIVAGSQRTDVETIWRMNFIK